MKVSRRQRPPSTMYNRLHGASGTSEFPGTRNIKKVFQIHTMPMHLIIIIIFFLNERTRKPGREI